MAQTQVSSVSQDELSKILAGNVDSILTPTDDTNNEPPKSEPPKGTEDTKPEENISLNFDWSDIEKIAEVKVDTDEEPADEAGKEGPKDKEDKGKAGRKPAELVSIVNELIEAGDLLPFEGDETTVKTVEEAKELIKMNLKEKEEVSEEDVKKKIKSSYSPQIQAILDYADQGGQNITPLMTAIAEVEKTAELDIDTESGQVAIVTEYLKATGWDEEEIKEHIETQKDLDKLKEKASKYLPKLNQMKSERIQMIMEENAQRQEEVEQTRRNYLGTIEQTLVKESLGGVKLSNKEKSKIWQSVADLSHKSFNGTNTNAFYKKLEDLQVGKSADYEHFLELVYYAVDKEGFKNKMKEMLNTENTAETVKKLNKQSAKPNSGAPIATENSKRPAISRGFKSPFG